MLKSASIEEKTFKHSPWAGADNPLARLQKCRQICIFSMPLVFTGIYGIYGKYGGKYGIYGKFNGQLSNMSCSTTAKKFQIGSFCFTMMTSSCSLL